MLSAAARLLGGVCRAAPALPWRQALHDQRRSVLRALAAPAARTVPAGSGAAGNAAPRRAAPGWAAEAAPGTPGSAGRFSVQFALCHYVLRGAAWRVCIKRPLERPWARRRSYSRSVYVVFNSVLTFSENFYLIGDKLRVQRRKCLDMPKYFISFWAG